MTHLGLANSELHVGADLDRHPRVRTLAADAGAALLFPGPGAVEPWSLTEGTLTTLVVLDGTWSQARKMLARSRLLQRLPRVAFRPDAPGAYRIRREPAPHCLTTIEAVVQVLGRLEDDPSRFAPLLGAFEQMVEQQLHYRYPPRSDQLGHHGPDAHGSNVAERCPTQRGRFDTPAASW